MAKGKIQRIVRYPFQAEYPEEAEEKKDSLKQTLQDQVLKGKAIPFDSSEESAPEEFYVYLIGNSTICLKYNKHTEPALKITISGKHTKRLERLVERRLWEK